MTRHQVVAIVDDDEAVLDSLTSLLRKRGFRTASMASAAALLAAIDAGGDFSCIVSDIRMPGMSGHNLHAELKRRRVATPVIFVTGHGDVGVAVRSMKSGIHDFIEKPIDAARLVASVRDAIERYEESRESEAFLRRIREQFSELSDRQKEIMRHVAGGHQNKEIAAILRISTRTVEHYRETVMERMGARNIADLVQMALQLELLPPRREP